MAKVETFKHNFKYKISELAKLEKQAMGSFFTVEIVFTFGPCSKAEVDFRIIV